MRYCLVSLVLLACLAACAGQGSGPDSSQRWVVLQQGSYQGTKWSLLAQHQHGQFCMELAPSIQHADAGWAGGCGFNEKHRGSGFYASGLGPGEGLSSFGPLPSRATQIRLAERYVLRTGLIPKTAGLPTGRFWVLIEPEVWPTARLGQPITPTPLDDAGHPVPFKEF